MIENTALYYQDVDTMIQNLMADAFTGFVKVDLEDSDGFLFYVEGQAIRGIQQTRQGECKVHRPERLLGVVQALSQVPTSSYILSPRLCNVLANSFTFKPLYKDYTVKRKELKKVLTNLEHDEFSGILQFDTQEGRVSVLLEHGEPVHDQFAHHYGQILCGRDAITGLFEWVHANGSTIQVYAEKANEIENKRRRIDEDLAKLKQVIVKAASGLFGVAKEAIRVDEEAAREWGLDLKSNFLVVIETMDGRRHEGIKAQSSKRKGETIEVGAIVMKQCGLQDGQSVLVFPAGG